MRATRGTRGWEAALGSQSRSRGSSSRSPSPCRSLRSRCRGRRPCRRERTRSDAASALCVQLPSWLRQCLSVRSEQITGRGSALSLPAPCRLSLHAFLLCPVSSRSLAWRVYTAGNSTATGWCKDESGVAADAHVTAARCAAELEQRLLLDPRLRLEPPILCHQSRVFIHHRPARRRRSLRQAYSLRV